MNYKSTNNFIFFGSSLLMILLAFFNKGYANDDHFTVIEIIYKFGKLPNFEYCWQCYHPKLFHFLAAQIWHLFEVESQWAKHTSAQLLNAVFGIGTLVFIKKYVESLGFNEAIKTMVLSLIMFNPRLIAITGQATNDSIIIFFGTVSIYAVLKLFKKPSLKWSWILVLSLCLGAMAKLNSAVVLIGAAISLIFFAFRDKNFSWSLKRGYFGTLLLSLITVSLAYLSFNGYYENIKEKGTPFTYNTPRNFGNPKLFEYEDFYLPGVQTVYSGFAKFHYLDLIKHPKINDGQRHKHITSYFSQLYGRTHYLYFDNWPKEWQENTTLMRNIGSISLAIAIVPTLLLFVGLFHYIFNNLNLVFSRNRKALKSEDSLVLLLFFFGFFGFSVLFSYYGRIYNFMKVIYVLPGILTVIKPLCYGYRWVFEKSKILMYGVAAISVSLVILYTIPILDLIYRLAIS